MVTAPVLILPRHRDTGCTGQGNNTSQIASSSKKCAILHFVSLSTLTLLSKDHTREKKLFIKCLLVSSCLDGMGGEGPGLLPQRPQSRVQSGHLSTPPLQSSL